MAEEYKTWKSNIPIYGHFGAAQPNSVIYKASELPQYDVKPSKPARRQGIVVVGVISTLLMIAAISLAIYYGFGVSDEDTMVMMQTELTFKDWTWTDALLVQESDEFKNMQDKVCSEVDKIYEGDMTYTSCNVIAFSQGSVKAETEITFDQSGTSATTSEEILREAAEKLTEAVENDLVFRDTETDVQFSDDVDDCLGANCDDNCIDQVFGHTCTCRDGFQLQVDGFTCTDINECDDETSGCSHICTNTEGSFECSCPEGYIDPPGSLKTCQDVDECNNGVATCDHTCTNTPGSYECKCDEGFTLQDDKYTCLDINECVNRNGGCDHDCVNNGGSFACRCDNGYELDPDGKTCTDIDECDVTDVPCGQICENTEGSFVCRCEIGYIRNADKITCRDTNECEVNNGGCEHNCENSEGSYTCGCNDGFLQDGFSCTAKDEDTGLVMQTELTFKNWTWTDALLVHESDEFKYMQNKVCSDVDKIYEGDMSYTSCNVIAFSQGSVSAEVEITFDQSRTSTPNEIMRGAAERLIEAVENDLVFRDTETDVHFSDDVDDCLGANCDDNCIDQVFGHTCTCENGYVLHEDGYSCEEAGGIVGTPQPPDADCDPWEFSCGTRCVSNSDVCNGKKKKVPTATLR